MTEIPRLHQSMAKILIADSPAALRKKLNDGWDSTRAMERGTIFDALVMSQTERIELVTALYKSGPRKGEPATDYSGSDAKQQAAEIRARGNVPALQCELDDADAYVAAVRGKLHSIPGPGAEILAQKTIQWTTALGVEAEGTPDWVVIGTGGVVSTIDLKRTACHPKRVQRQIAAMFWHLQAAAYKEAALDFARTIAGDGVKYGGHTLLCCDPDSGCAPRAYPLSAVSMEVGRRRWEQGQRAWSECWSTGEWPDYPETELDPPRYEISEVMGYAESDLSDLGLDFGKEEATQ